MDNKQKLAALVSVFAIISAVVSFLFPKTANASLTSSSVTLGNSRLSYKAGVATGTLGSSLVTIDNSGFPDNNTNHLFPGDILCFTDAGQDGCIGSTTYAVDSIVDSTHFNLTSPLGANLDTSGYAVATQSGTWTVAFTTVAQVPNGGSILITIPMADNASGNNGIPDSSSTVATSGFDLNKIAAGNISITGCTPADWGAPAITVGSGTSDHTVSIPRNTTACPASSAIVVTIAGPGIANPAAITSGHTQGTADVYGVTVATRDGGDNTIDSSVPRAAIVEAVLISTTVDESLSFVVAGLGAGTYCGNSTMATTATSVPWGHLGSTNAFYYAAQQLTVSTNASSGYSVTIQENDQMGKNGNVCTGTAPSLGHYTFGSNTCIRDTVCASGNCSESTAADWTDATGYPGLGYSEASQSGTDAPFYYSEKTRTFSSKQLADAQGSETPQVIMNNSGPVSGSSIYVCYRISVPGNQPSGYYYNVAKYTATATF
jgi:hypothetical protein